MYCCLQCWTTLTSSGWLPLHAMWGIFYTFPFMQVHSSPPWCQMGCQSQGLISFPGIIWQEFKVSPLPKATEKPTTDISFSIRALSAPIYTFAVKCHWFHLVGLLSLWSSKPQSHESCHLVELCHFFAPPVEQRRCAAVFRRLPQLFAGRDELQHLALCRPC